ncbi:MAG: RecQ family ATP-dependent DNA helicase [Prevotella sp.]|nr:RecQ family ATP-dependent DNA helicase [Prevotella sp.]
MDYRQILREYWGYDNFRGIQEEIIQSICSGKDTLGLMPTGGGKSITFQVPALSLDGVCIVITPLIALMKDQVDHLKAKGISAAAIYSGMTRDEILKTLENAVFGAIKLLYVSPERIGSPLFQKKVSHMHVSFITVDEAHCISQWGYDFRPAYLQITNLRKIKPEAPILALTATATHKVIDDIQQCLAFREKNVFRMSFERKNLAYVVRIAADKEAELVHILQAVPGCAIVYVRSRKKTKEIAQLLQENNITATSYHAGLEHVTKTIRQEEWMSNKVRVMVATNAFGMGIDKPDVRLVIHIDGPDSIEAYFQEAGRAGRDGKKAYAVLLYNSVDARKLQKRIDDNFPPKDYIRKVYDSLAYYFQIGIDSGAGYTFNFDINKFCKIYQISITYTLSSLHILSQLGHIVYEDDPSSAARIQFLLSRNQLYYLDHLTPKEDATIEAILRLYGGLFNDYVYIDEQLISQHAGLSPQEVYLILKGLTEQRIVHFIPQRKMPFIHYLRNRIDGFRLNITSEVYEDRKLEYEKRIQAFINYAENSHICRSRQLLEYFGETVQKDCNQCDVCLGEKQHISDKIVACQTAIIQLLRDGKPHCTAEMHALPFAQKDIEKAMEQLLNEEHIDFDGTFMQQK